jgi:ribose transport system permease protein
MHTITRLAALREIGVLGALLVVIALFALVTPHFFSAPNLLLITRQMAILAIIATGETFVLASGEVDISVGWGFNLIMTAMAFSITRFGLSPWAAIGVALATGIILGLVNGFVAVTFGLSTVIVTLATMTTYRGIAMILNNGRPIILSHDSSFFLIGNGSIGGIPNMTLIMIPIVIAGAWVLKSTGFATHLLAMGGNPAAANRLGLRTRRLRVSVMALCGLTCGLAGALGLSFLGAADPQNGGGMELQAIAAAIIGGAQLGGGSGTIWGTLIGVALVMVIQDGLVLLGLPLSWQIASPGLVIIGAVTLDYLTRARRARAARDLLDRAV